ncbi:c-type cytochrome [Spirosoma fluviale]|uniref:Quinol:cytochrome c oxidoreductase pentaheme cytochrome subunit n=1 Tax=Spirosoma fluviale TaxID=1597977 RepID=A0A286GKF5_9BACT|nr:c-type cytochrome [Spirosoma fluviale]SOD96018.1 quinol:cytochrome c oxidoreductase pentaheme cytochrome subunit [Spirosoma fluviale]
MLINSKNIVHKMSRFYKLCVAIVLSLTLLVSSSQVKAQDAAAGGAPAADAAAPAGGGDVEKGKSLFTNNCAQCHAVTAEKVVGPGLKGIEERAPSKDWLHKWIRNSSALIASGDAYANQVFNANGKVQMSSFPNLSDADIDGILAYVDQASKPAAVASVAGADNTKNAGGAGGAGPSTGGPSELFTFVLVALLIVMLLVLGVLLAIVTILSKAVTPATADGTLAASSFGQRLKTGLSDAFNNPTLRSIVIWLFLLVVTKATIDGAYSVGVQQGYAPKQPIAYSHKLHAGQYKIDCNYCHTGAQKGKSATIPSANICMNCHGVIKKESPEIQKIYTAIEKNQPIEWVRVHNLPDLAYFNHAQHVNVGNVACQTCHGEIEKMEVVEQRSSLTMGWCIDCHRRTEVNTKDNAYYDKLVALHKKESKDALKVANIGGLECSKCHY